MQIHEGKRHTSLFRHIFPHESEANYVFILASVLSTECVINYAQRVYINMAFVERMHYGRSPFQVCHPAAISLSRNMIKAIFKTTQLHACNSFKESATNQWTSVLPRVQVKDLLTSSPSPWWSILTHLSKVMSNILIKHMAAEQRT